VAANGNSSNPNEGGIATNGSGGTGTVQIGYQTDTWGLAALYSSIQNGNDIIVYGTTFALESFTNKGTTSAFALSGYWQPEESGWIPSISAGWGINSTFYNGSVYNDPSVDASRLVTTSQSWSVGLDWTDVFIRGNNAGMAVGQPVFATALESGDTPRDGNDVWEWWYQFQVTDNISITPALFYLSRPYGQDTPAGDTFNQFGGLVKTQFLF
jgi:Carbohydrate-selective porin, OprB family.